MQIMQHNIEIAVDRQSAFQFCLNVEKWPEYFEPCKKAKVVFQDEHQQLIEITALADQELLTWQSERMLDNENTIIYFHQSKPSELFDRMEGSWRFYATEKGCLVSLEHCFVLKKDEEDDLKKARHIIDENSQKELASMKQILESSKQRIDGLSLIFSDAMFIKAPVPYVFSRLKQVEKWPDILPHCQAIDMLYDDGVYQEFMMTIVTPRKNETMRSVRICRENYRIDYFQPNPPEILKKHTGYWTVEKEKNGTKITAYHRVEINPHAINDSFGAISSQEALNKVKEAIQKNSVATMHAIAGENV